MTAQVPTRERTPIEEGRVRFTPLQMENIHTHFRWNNDPELNRLDSEVPYEEESFGAFKARFEQLCVKHTPTQHHFEIHDAEEDMLIGVAYVARLSTHHEHAQVGITIGETDYWGEGYGRESLRLLLRHCFESLNLHRVSAETFEYNTVWRDLVEGMGFTREGVARDYLYRDGQYWDKAFYALLEDEYRAQHTAQTESTRAPVG